MRAIVDGWCLEWGFTISCLMGVKGNRKAPWTRVKQWPLDPGTNWMAPYSQFEQFLFKSKTRGENTQRMRFWSCFIGTRGTRERKREWVAICWCERVAMGFVTSWFSFLGGQMFENPCLHGSHRKYMWLASIPVSVSKKMIHIRFAGQITTFAGVSPASSIHFIHQLFGPCRTGSGCGQHPFVADFRGQGLWDGRQLPWTTGTRKQRGANEVRIRRWWFSLTWRENSEITMGEDSIEGDFMELSWDFIVIWWDSMEFEWDLTGFSWDFTEIYQKFPTMGSMRWMVPSEMFAGL